ncbi:cell wall hydrolase [Altererythrobacter arenosus]|uniref:Cell wall hydrolase n=1 Tax=Altererythrobacter arenosus TaxID=3032592 RepID=A0ABY8FPD7_9SPHN|nr:cell wall hydrolase [Altererythrobacter sp. CAU 1644]WFL75965.1 cell wall hydrolase [Altererythrobacter sp. CAU 1644]
MAALAAEGVLAKASLIDAKPFHYGGSVSNRVRAADCLAAAAWYEAGNDPVGQRAVIQTVINRVNHPAFPNTVCGVVFQGSELSTGCQFTFTCDGSLARRQPPKSSWKKALALSEDALNGFVDTSIGTATHYHASYVNPWWSSKLERLTSVGPHIFYRWAGARGSFRKQAFFGTEAEYRELVRKSTERGAIGPGLEDGEIDQDLANLHGDGLVPGTRTPTVPVSNAIFMQVGDASASGRWAISAMKACEGRRACQVLGYGDGGKVQANQQRSASERDRPLFLFVRDAASSMNIALWDCERTSRPQQSQCLPTDRGALLNLMRERS